MYNTEKLAQFRDYATASNYYCGYHLPSDFVDRLNVYRRSTFNFFGCYNDKLLFYSSNNSFDSGANALLIYYDINNNNFEMNDIILPSDNNLALFQSLVVSMPSTNIYSGNDLSSLFLQRVGLNQNYYDDLINSNKPSEYIISMLYIFIPILLFIIGIKVLRKGLFK